MVRLVVGRNYLQLRTSSHRLKLVKAFCILCFVMRLVSSFVLRSLELDLVRGSQSGTTYGAKSRQAPGRRVSRWAPTSSSSPGRQTARHPTCTPLWTSWRRAKSTSRLVALPRMRGVLRRRRTACPCRPCWRSSTARAGTPRPWEIPPGPWKDFHFQNQKFNRRVGPRLCETHHLHHPRHWHSRNPRPDLSFNY